MIPTAANGQPAAVAYYRGGDGAYLAFGLGVLTVTEAGIARILVFGGGPALVATFGLPETLPPAQPPSPTRSTPASRPEPASCPPTAHSSRSPTPCGPCCLRSGPGRSRPGQERQSRSPVLGFVAAVDLDQLRTVAVIR